MLPTPNPRHVRIVRNWLKVAAIAVCVLVCLKWPMLAAYFWPVAFFVPGCFCCSGASCLCPGSSPHTITISGATGSCGLGANCASLNAAWVMIGSGGCTSGRISGNIVISHVFFTKTTVLAQFNSTLACAYDAGTGNCSSTPPDIAAGCCSSCGTCTIV